MVTVRADLYEMEVTVNLAELGLAHAEGSECTCKGEHPLTLRIDLEDHELHSDYDCEVAGVTTKSVQRLHQQAHPKGTLYAENCREQSCLDALSGF